MNLKEPLPIIFPQVVVLPGCIANLELSSSDTRALLSEWTRAKKNRNDGVPIYVGIVPSASGYSHLKPGTVGTCAKVISCTRTMQSNDWEISVAGLKRMVVKKKADGSKSYTTAYVSLHEDPKESLEQIISELNKVKLIPSFADPSFAAQLKRLGHEFSIDRLADELRFSFEDKLALLETLSFSARLTKFLSLMEHYSDGRDDLFRSPQSSRHSMRVTVIKPNDFGSQKAFRIGNSPIAGSIGAQANQDLAKKIKEAQMPPAVHKVAMDELARLNAMSNFASEHSVLRTYLETLSSLPWNVGSLDEIDLNNAKQELDRDHYAMEKVKRRVLEYLAVRQLRKSHLRGPVLCFVGPPGVGKTSIGRSIAKILGRKFHRIGLGGMSDANDIRGSRRTYVGSMPGRIIQSIKQCGTNNPVILLDEVDKMSDGKINGNPLAALLEVLDPEQNSQFTDHYLGVPFDLSQVIFIATANGTNTVPPALKDRMETIDVCGYTEEEKYHIAKDFIIPKLLTEHGINSDQLLMPEETLRFIVSAYTREAGVRTLERKIAAIFRDAALKIAAMMTKDEVPLGFVPLFIDEATVKAVLGGPGYEKSADRQWTEGSTPGVVVGLAFTGMGGEILPIETSKLVPGSGKLILTGKLGKVLSESATIAMDWFKNVSPKYQLLQDMRTLDVHIHLPSGAVSKEGPSAGIALATSLVSLFSGLPVLPNLALTGELTLQGYVLPVGGLKEKLTAAHRAGITKVIVPKKCETSLEDLPQHLVDSLELIPVEHMSEVINCAFNGAIGENRALLSKL